MARPTKQGLEYFPMDVDADTDEALEYVIAKRGFIAFGVYVRLLMGIYKDGYYTEWNERKLFVYAKRMMMDTETLSEIISDFVTAGLFSQEMLAKGILTSASIQKRYLAATERRKTAGIAEEYDLVSAVINSEKTPAEKELIPKKTRQEEINSELTPQSKVKESKVNKKENKKEKQPTPKKSYAENVTMTVEEYEKLKERFNGNEIAVKKCIDILDNYKGANGKTYKNDYRAILTWVVDKYEKENPSNKSSHCQYDFSDSDDDENFGVREGSANYEHTSGAAG